MLNGFYEHVSAFVEEGPEGSVHEIVRVIVFGVGEERREANEEDISNHSNRPRVRYSQDN